MARTRLLLLLFLLIWPHCGVVAQEALDLVISDANPLYSNAERTGIVDELAFATFARLQYPITITQLPSARALLGTNKGMFDGDLLRIQGVEKKFPNLVQVPEPWLEMAFIAFAKQPGVRVHNWEDLKELHVAHIKGWRVFERYVKGARSTLLVSNAPNLFKLLNKDRVDAILYDREQGEYYRDLLGMDAVYQAGEPLLVAPVYLYVHKRYAALVEPIANMIRTIKRERLKPRD